MRATRLSALSLLAALAITGAVVEPSESGPAVVDGRRSSGSVMVRSTRKHAPARTPGSLMRGMTRSPAVRTGGVALPGGRFGMHATLERKLE